MKKRWIALYVENNVGVLAKISGLFSGKAYNMESLTVGTTEDSEVSRITIGANCTGEVFEQLKKQLNRMIDIIKVIDLTDADIIKKELMFIKFNKYAADRKQDMLDISNKYNGEILEDNENVIVFQSLNTEEINNEFIKEMKKFKGIKVIRGGSVAVDLYM